MANSQCLAQTKDFIDGDYWFIVSKEKLEITFLDPTVAEALKQQLKEEIPEQVGSFTLTSKTTEFDWQGPTVSIIEGPPKPIPMESVEHDAELLMTDQDSRIHIISNFQATDEQTEKIFLEFVEELQNWQWQE